ncbi:probable serine hydrolase isoform X2 [Ooceraea biroi]|uniref:probable serine hydrolase isoform X2 n=1 Tax=Ooceraea biroi TaxID=2015173 RepID=UPI000F077FA0|nr:probable serine hydrolase isoform X2 [Ooceraea biroi]
MISSTLRCVSAYHFSVLTNETCTRGVVERLLNSRIPTSPISSRSVIVAMENNETTSTTHDSHGVTNGRLAKDVEEIKIPVPWGHVSGKWWGSKSIQPIIALHGRQDNAGSFDTLIPLLPDDVSVLCLDMPGHGLSSHYPKSQFYYVYWDGIILLRKIIEYFKWNKVKLLGHSLGGAIGFLYAATYPNEVDFLISLDVVSPLVRNVEKIASLTGDYIDKFLKYDLLMLDCVPCYEYDDMITIVENAYEGSITREAAEILMKRGMQPAHERGKYYFSRDPKLKVSFLGVLSLDLILQFASQIRCPYLNIRAIPGQTIHGENYGKVLEKVEEGVRRFEYHEVEGTHHVHLNEPEKVAPIINRFLRD